MDEVSSMPPEGNRPQWARLLIQKLTLVDVASGLESEKGKQHKVSARRDKLQIRLKQCVRS